MLQQFETALDQVIAAIATLQPKHRETPRGPTTPLDRAAVAPHLTALAEAIQRHRADAMACCQTLQPFLTGTRIQDTLQQVETDLEKFAFKEAQTHLVALCNALDMPLPALEKP